MDDYAHHPTEIAAALAALKSHRPARLVLIFQPHLYTRTRIFMEDFARVLAGADLCIVTDIYPAREAPIPGVDAAAVAELARAKYAANIEYQPFDTVVDSLSPRLQENDIVVTMGAGNVDRIAKSLAKRLSDNSTA